MSANAQSKLSARYGATDISPPTQWNEVIEQLLDHRSVRAFTDQPLPDGTIETLIAAAQSASTSSISRSGVSSQFKMSIARSACPAWPAIRPISIKPHCSWSGSQTCPGFRA
ncbi:nitroreductase family protein [Pseudomonas qingdaonensis]|uniref:nitroreductase family protein n=1 Tax=Pseudomonas qingdaonensis TaxID=2056231 RepID=UPI0035A22CC3